MPCRSMGFSPSWSALPSGLYALRAGSGAGSQPMSHRQDADATARACVCADIVMSSDVEISLIIRERSENRQLKIVRDSSTALGMTEGGL
jgi:hypothetical protein